MKNLLALVLVGCLGLSAAGCKDTVNVDVNKKKPDCCKTAEGGGGSAPGGSVVVPVDPHTRLKHCPCSAVTCSKDPADYSKAHKCPCGSADCVCERG